MYHTDRVELFVEAIVGRDQVPEVTNGIRDVKRLVAIYNVSQSHLDVVDDRTYRASV